MKNLVASIQDRLRNRSRSEGIELNRVLENFAIARLFARLSASSYRDQFILKGAQLFVLWADAPHRSTRDADFLSFGSPEPAGLESIFNEMCASETAPSDGLEWLPGKASAIREDNLYGGVRIKLIARLGSIRIPVQVDVGFGDAITPAAKSAKWPGVLDFPPVSLLVYCPETTIAEKFHAAVVLETANSRMKDFFDIYWLSCHQTFKGKLLREAIVATFQRRSTELPVTTPIALTNRFYSLPDKQLQWTGFLRKSQLDPLDFEIIIRQITRFLLPVMNDEVENHEWHPETGWTEPSS
ncbi:MAG: nucleotidyl transferase AbiEii/AbiGii toxin family protein [Luteolibacter sp.]